MELEKRTSYNVGSFDFIYLKPLKTFFLSSNVSNVLMDNFYNAAGQKVRKKVYEMTAPPSGTIKDVEYLDGFQYVGGTLNFFPTAEGYVSVTESNSLANPLLFNYVYNYTDHLGNIRFSYTKDPVSGVLTKMEENHYYPFGLKHGVYSGISMNYQLVDNLPGTEPEARPTYVYKTDYQYKYQGQELQDELGLNWYSYKYRNYDAAIGRFMSVDPLTEKYVDWGPYVFSGNRVIDAVELEGLEPALLKVLANYAKKGIDYVAKTTKGDIKPISRNQAVKKLQNQETIYSTGSAKDAKKIMKESTDKKVVRHDGHDLPNGKKGMDHYQKKSGDGSHANYGVDKSIVPVAVVTTSEKETGNETQSSNEVRAEKAGQMVSNLIDDIQNLIGEFVTGGGIPILSSGVANAPAPQQNYDNHQTDTKNKDQQKDKKIQD